MSLFTSLIYCQFDTMELLPVSEVVSGRKRCHVIRERCFGCGICESKCRNGAISLVPDPHKGVPLNIEALAQTNAGETGL